MEGGGKRGVQRQGREERKGVCMQRVDREEAEVTDLGIARYVEGHLELAPLEGAVDKAIAAGADVLVTSGDKKGGGFPCCGRRVGACKNMLKHLDIKGHTFDNTWEFASSHYNSAGHFKILSCGWVCLCVNAGVSMGDRDLLKPLCRAQGLCALC